MAVRIDITGDAIQTKVASDSYRNNWDHIFGKNKKNTTTKQTTESMCSGIQEWHGTGNAGTSREFGCPLLV